jgi:predicted AAA+ superfamily ATPase
LEIYLKKGGLGAIVPFYENDVKIFNKLNDIFLCSIKKDIKEHHHVKFEDGLERISKYIYSNIGKSFSATNIENFLRSNKEVIILKKTILNYLK